MLTVDLICDRCGRTKSVELPYRASRPWTDAVAIGLEVFEQSGYRRQDGQQVCRWCALRGWSLGQSGKIREIMGKLGPVAVPVLKCVGLAVLAIGSVLLKIILLERIEDE